MFSHKVTTHGDFLFLVLLDFMFFVPIEIAGTSSIIVDHVHLAIRALFGGLMPYIALIMILAGAILPLIRKSYKNSFADFVIVVFKVLGAIIGVMYVFILVQHYYSKGLRSVSI